MVSTTMLGLRESLSRQLHADGNPWDDGPLPDFTSGLMWTATGVFGAAVLALPGSDRSHIVARARARPLRRRLGPGLDPDGGARTRHGARPARARDRRDDAARRALAVCHRWRHELHPARDDLHGAVHLVLLPAAAGLAADGAVRLRVRDAALLRPRALAVGYPARTRDVRARGGRGDRRGPVPQEPPRARRAAPAHDGGARPAHRRCQPARLRPGARARRGDRRPVRARPDRSRRLQARQRRAGPSRRGRRAAVRGDRGGIRGPSGRLPGPHRRGRVRAHRSGCGPRRGAAAACATCATRSSPRPPSRPHWPPRTPARRTSWWRARTLACWRRSATSSARTRSRPSHSGHPSASAAARASLRACEARGSSRGGPRRACGGGACGRSRTARRGRRLVVVRRSARGHA